jgi:predicted MPP superfamily phosphohydrolase
MPGVPRPMDMNRGKLVLHWYVSQSSTPAPANFPPQAPPQVASKYHLRKRLRVAAGLLTALIVVLAIDVTLIEPFRIQVTHYQLHGPVNAPLKIAHLSDIHTHGFGRRERRLVEILRAENPDVILITGDTLGEMNLYAPAQNLYRQMHASLGVWVVRGNFENTYRISPRRERALYDDAGVNLQVNANHQLRPDVWVAGVDDPATGDAKLDAALSGIPAGVFSILLFHSPAFFDLAAGRASLCLAGHTHGGQVRLPFLKPMWLPKGVGRYLDGWYEQQGSKMYVSRGLGMSKLPIRFLCRPEVTFITVEP